MLQSKLNSSSLPYPVPRLLHNVVDIKPVRRGLFSRLSDSEIEVASENNIVISVESYSCAYPVFLDHRKPLGYLRKSCYHLV